ncbi:hypothetical protein ACFQFH_05440 [Halobaculum halobium]|uniref:hypothetical protein n=1 Tax=Halobaculum halobium TaxID=3032281 RepID=UPI003606AABC
MLVAGFALAVVLVALVLLANTAIFTENLATRDNGVGEREVLGYRASVVDGAGGIIDRENAAEYDGHDPLEENVTAGQACSTHSCGKSAPDGPPVRAQTWTPRSSSTVRWYARTAPPTTRGSSRAPAPTRTGRSRPTSNPQATGGRRGRSSRS